MTEEEKDRKELMERAAEVKRCTLIGLVVNAVLSALKIAAGIVGRSGAMIADGVHSVSDFATDIVVLAFVGVTARGIDRRYHYGHGKFETFATMIIAVVLMVVAVGLFWSSGESVLRSLGGEEIEAPSYFALVMAAISIITKEILYRYTAHVGDAVKSMALVANAWHHRSDALSSVGTAIGIGGAIALGSQWAVLDPIAAVIVSLLIIMQAVKQIRQSSDELLEKSLPDDIERHIKDIVLEERGASDIHHLCTRRIGSTVAIEMHVRMPGEMTLSESHAHATAIEKRLREAFGTRTHIVLHVEPLKPEGGQAQCQCRQ